MEFEYWPLQGLKPDVDLVGFIGMTEVMPCYKAFEIQARNEFFRSLSAPCSLRNFRSTNNPAASLRGSGRNAITQCEGKKRGQSA